MDISDFKLASDAQRMKVKHPVTKAETDIVIFCLSPEHPSYKEKTAKLAAEQRVTNEAGEVDPDALKTFALGLNQRKNEMIAALVTGWENITVGEEPFAYSPENAVKLMTDWPWLRDQLDAFCGKRENFFAKPAKA